jgi:5-(carboxyamino)imidazole ribonucleotide mutase
MSTPIVSIIMGSDSDLPIMSEAAYILEQLDIPFECTIVSAHRTPDRMVSFAREAKSRGIKVIIAGAGGAAHLPGMVAALTAIPVIGVPIRSKTFDGTDALFSIVQMPPGIPVATVAIQGAKNAGILAVQILGSFDDQIYQRICTYKEELKNIVEEKVALLEQSGYKQYLKLIR